MQKKTREVYVCDCCKSEYYTQEAAEKCEAAHIEILGINEARYGRGHCYPDTISIKMGNNKNVVYSFRKELDPDKKKEVLIVKEKGEKKE